MIISQFSFFKRRIFFKLIENLPLICTINANGEMACNTAGCSSNICHDIEALACTV